MKDVFVFGTSNNCPWFLLLLFLLSFLLLVPLPHFPFGLLHLPLFLFLLRFVPFLLDLRIENFLNHDFGRGNRFGRGGSLPTPVNLSGCCCSSKSVFKGGRRRVSGSLRQGKAMSTGWGGWGRWGLSCSWRDGLCHEVLYCTQGICLGLSSLWQ